MSDTLKYNLKGIAVLAAMVIIFTVNNNTLKLVVGIGLVAGLVTALIQTQQSIELSTGLKRLSWIILIPLMSIIGYLFAIIE